MEEPLSIYGDQIYRLEMNLIDNPVDRGRIRVVRSYHRELLFMKRMISPILGTTRRSVQRNSNVCL